LAAVLRSVATRTTIDHVDTLNLNNSLGDALTDTLTVKLPRELGEQIVAEARRRNVSKSTIVRESLERTLRGAKGAKEVSCADLAGALVGSVRSGRRDLATNKALLTEAVAADAKRGRKQRRR
jgi:predicted DNA-binding protein